MPFLSRLLQTASADRPEDRAEDLDRFIVPEEARFLIAAVDVQGGQTSRFEFEVRAFGPGLEWWIVDRGLIMESPRGTKESPVQVDPAAFPEDWDAITAKLVNGTYRTAAGRELRVLLTVVDSGGEAGVTPNAYAWYRRLAKAGLGKRVLLVKGGATKDSTPILRSNGREASGKVMKDVPLFMLNTDYYKDIVATSLRRKEPGPGFAHFPKWLPANYYEQLQAEIREVKSGKASWRKIRARNEALDLWVYALAGAWSLGAHKLDWENPPAWARSMDTNSEAMSPEERRIMKAAAVPPKPKSPFASEDWSARL